MPEMIDSATGATRTQSGSSASWRGHALHDSQWCNQRDAGSAGASPSLRRKSRIHQSNILVHAFSILAVGICVLGAGCRETEPQPSLYVDLGDAGRPLPLPARTAWVDPSTKNGRAEWQPFREPSIDAMRGEDDGSSENGDASLTNGGKIESEIRAMLADYNELAAEGKRSELLDFYVTGQVDFIQKLFEQQASFLSLLEEFRQLLSEQLPAEGERIERTFELLRAQGQERLQIGAINVLSDAEAAGEMIGLAEGTLARFVIEDNAWFVELPESFVTTATAQMPQLIQAFEQAKSAVAAGQLPAEQIFSRFEQMATRLGGDQSEGSSEGGLADAMRDATAVAIEDPAPSPETLKTGGDAYTTANCFRCHGADGKGTGRGPDLTDAEWVHCDGSIDGILSVIKTGITSGQIKNTSYPFAMNPATNFIQDEATLAALAAYVHSLSQ